MHETPVGSVLDGRADGVCKMLIFVLLKKSAEPPQAIQHSRTHDASRTGVGIDITVIV